MANAWNLDDKFAKAALAGMAVIGAIAWMGTILRLPTSLPGFLMGVWVYLGVHRAMAGTADMRQFVGFSVLFTALLIIVLLFGGIILVIALDFPKDILGLAFPFQDTNLFLGVPGALATAAIAGGAFGSIKK